MRVVVDCNILVSSLASKSPYHDIYKSLVSGQYDLIVSHDILLEYEEIIQVKYGLETASSFMMLLSLLPNVHYIHPYYKWNLISQDPDDNKYCDCAVSGIADYIVTEDKHFNVLEEIEFPPIAVVGIDVFIKMLPLA